MNTLRIAVLASGHGSNLAALIAARANDTLPVEFVLVASDRRAAGALRLAEASGIPCIALDPRAYPHRQAFDLALFEQLAAAGADLLVLAGFMRVIDARALQPWLGRTINIHPSLLPKYRGLHTHRRAIEAGERWHGASVHFVTSELDGGPVIAQVRLALRADDDEHRLAQRLLPLEHRLLPAVVAAIARRHISLDGQVVHFRGQPIRCPLQLMGDRLQIDTAGPTDAATARSG